MKYSYLTYIAILSLLFSTSVSAQQTVVKKDLDKSSLKTLKKADTQLRKKEYEKAIRSLDKVIKKHPTFVDAYLKRSGVQYNLKRYEESISSLDQALAISPEYNPEVYFSKGIILKKLERHREAAFNFDMYVDRAKDGERKQKAITYYEQSKFIDFSMSNPVPYKPTKLAGDINSEMSEYIPALTLDSKKMIFTRRVGNQEDLYTADLIDGKYQNIKALEEVNTPYNDGVHTISADGNRIIFTACNRPKEVIGGCDLFTARYIDGAWSKARNLGPVINTPAWEAQPTLSSDGYTLFWSSNRKYGSGGNDIWMSTRTDTSSWTEPVPLSENINTKANEESPFIHPDGKTLYFRSNRSIGMGGYDIFYSRYNDTTSMWNAAKNIGYPINTKNDEGAMSVSLDGSLAFFATDQHTGIDGGRKNLDLYTFALYEEARPLPVTFVEATAVDDETGMPVKARIEIVKIDGDREVKEGVTGRSGKYVTSLLAGHKYAFYVSADKYVFNNEHFDLQEIRTSYDPYLLEIRLSRLLKESTTSTVEPVKTKPVTLNNIFFESGSSILTLDSKEELDRLSELLLTDSNIKIEIAGHTDNVGTAADNLKLSQDRAKAVLHALEERGVNKSQLSSIGYGESLPVADNDTEKGRKQNRRTTFQIK